MKLNFLKFSHSNEFQFSVCGSDAHIQKFKKADCLNNFQSANKGFTFSYSLIFNVILLIQRK